ncbi:MAG TPA: hypothetical protein VF532_15570 [Candidatus Angelobacter sp.]
MTTTGKLYSTPAPKKAEKHLPGPSTRKLFLTLIAVILLVTYAGAQLPMPASTQFDITGFIQEATLDSSCTADPHCGGTIKLNGHTIIVPKETIVIFPANALTWQEIFAQAPAPYGLLTNPPSTGLARADLPAPLTTYEAQAVGNRVLGGPAGADLYIAGLIYISQQGLNTGSGFINYINYAAGEMRVGGALGNPTDGARVRINDPAGRFGRVMSPDVRFTVDPDNPTIASSTGFPMCFPRVDPATAVDPLCPQSQRPAAVAPAVGFASVIQTNDPGALPGVPPDATIQAPFEVGDWITFSGTLVQDGLTPTAGPFPGTANTYISAHTISNNVAVFTWPNTNPAYVSIETTLIGTGGLIVLGAGEAVIRTRFEGMMTDVNQNAALQRIIHLYGVDLSPFDGSTTDRDFGTIGVDPGPPNGANKGRWRFRPPCLPFGTIPTKPDKDCVMNAAGTFLPPPREVRAVIEGAWIPGQTTTYANGIIAGQYHAPISEYIFPENIPGTPIVANNFEAILFLTQGGYTSSAGTLVGQLNPWPGLFPPPVGDAPPVANAGGPYTVGSGGTIGLSGTTTAGTAPFTYQWTASAGTFDNATLANPNYTAPQTASGTTVNLSFTATNAFGTSTANTTVTVNAALAPVVNPIAPTSVTSGDAGTITVTASDPNTPPSVPLTWTVSQTGNPPLINLAINPSGPASGVITYTSKSGVSTPTDITVTVTARNAAGVSSAPVSTTVTINPAGPVCNAPVANAGGPYTVGAGGSIVLSGSATGSPAITYSWTATAGSFTSGNNTATPTYKAPVVLAPTAVTVSLTATNKCGPGGTNISNTASSTVTVNAALPPTVNPVTAVSVFSGAAGSINVTGSDPNVPAMVPLTWTVSQTGAPALLNLIITSTGSTTARINFTAPTLPVGQVTPAVITLTITARNTAPLNSAPITTTVTVNPLPDVIAITSAEYRTGKQRLIINATSSVVSPNVVLKLQPYLTATGTIYNPDPAAGGLGNVFTNTGGGLYLLDISGAPRPACGNAAGYQTPCPSTPLDVKSNLNGDSGPFGLTRIRQ